MLCTTELTVQLLLDKVHSVCDIVLDRVYVVQQVEVPLLLLPAIVWAPGTTLLLYLRLRSLDLGGAL